MNSEERRREEDREPEERTEEEITPIEEPAGGAEDPGVVEEPEEDAFPDGTQPDDVDPEADASADGGAEADALREELEATRLERDQYREDMMYLRAEFDNVRKRQERERDRIVRSASEELVRELLPVLDNLERALEVEGDVREGVRATLEQFAGVLGGEGLAPVASDGQPFDPSIHEAVMSQPSEEHEENTVLQTFQRGYTLNGKAIRTAKVIVAR